MAGSQTLKFDILADASSATRAFKQTADGAALAARGAKQFSESLNLQSRSARASADATLALAKSDSILRDAQLTLAGATDDASGSLGTLRRRLDELQGKTAAARVSLEGDKEAQARLDAISARLTDLDHKTSTPNLDIQGTARATAELSAVDVALDKVGGKGGSAEGAAASLGALGSRSGAIAALVAAGVALSPVLVTSAVGLGGLALAAKNTIEPILQAGTATKKAQKALADLDPAQKAAYQSLTSLKSEFSGFGKSLEPEVLSVFDKGLGVASTLLHDIEPVAAAAGKALAGVVAEFGADLKTQQWQQFFAWMTANAGPDIQLLGKLFIDTANDIPSLLEALQPLAQGLLEIGDIAAKSIGPLAKMLSWFTSPTGSATAFANSGKAASGAAGDFQKLIAQAQKAADQMKQAGGNAAAAGPQVGTLAGDMALLDTNTTDANTALSAYNDAWSKIVGSSLSDQQAVLADEGAFKNLTDAVKNSGGKSLQARQAFVSYIQQVGTSISTLEQNGASVRDVNAEYETNIHRLESLHGLTPQQRADVQGLKRDYDVWANSTAGLNKNTLTAAGTIKNDFIQQLGVLTDKVPGLKADVSNFADAILKTGNSSSATKGDRAALIADLEKAGIKASDAKAFADGLQKTIDNMHGKTVNIGLTTSGSGQIIITGTGITSRTINTTTGQVRAIGGHTARGGYINVGTTPTADDVLVMASKGELVVPANMVKAGAVNHLRGKIPGFASGGVVGAVSSAEGQVAGAEAAFGQSAVTAFAQSALKAAQSAAAALAPAAGAGGGVIAAMMKNMAAARGWTGAQWDALYAVEQREAGFNMTARNPTSGAYGLAQFINGPSEYYAYGGNPTTAMGQVTGMLNYIAQRYGTPANAWAHEVNYGWYDRGGMLKPGLTLAYNGTGRPEQVVPAGRSGGGGPVTMEVHFHAPVGSQQELKRWLLEANRELARTKGGGSVQTAFGRS